MVESAVPYETAKAENKKIVKEAKNATSTESSGQKQMNDEENLRASGDIADSGENLDTSGDMNFVFDIPLQISAELGQLNMTIRELLSLNIGSIIELEKLQGNRWKCSLMGKKFAEVRSLLLMSIMGCE